MQAKIFLLSVGLRIILCLLLCATGHRWKLSDETTSSKEDVSVFVFPVVDLMTFCKNRAKQKFTSELKEDIRAYKSYKSSGCVLLEGICAVSVRQPLTFHVMQTARCHQRHLLWKWQPPELCIYFFFLSVIWYEFLLTLCEHKRQAWEQWGKIDEDLTRLIWMQDKTHLFKKKKPNHLEIGFSWNAAKHDFMSNACLSACLFKTYGFLLLGSFIWVVNMCMTNF